jgi:hypothetical protein
VSKIILAIAIIIALLNILGFTDAVTKSPTKKTQRPSKKKVGGGPNHNYPTYEQRRWCGRYAGNMVKCQEAKKLVVYHQGDPNEVFYTWVCKWVPNVSIIMI